MSEVNIVVGLSGVGKGTVLEQAMNLADRDYEVINYGDRMFETAKKEGLVDDRDEMKELDVKTYKRIQKQAADSIAKDSEDGDVIVETHAAIKTPFGYIPGLPEWTVKNLEPDKIVMIAADAEDIFKRAQEDESRDREHETVEGVQEYQNVAREMAGAGAVLTGAYLKVIQNEEGKVEAAAEELVETLRG